MTNNLPGFNAEASLHESDSNYRQIYSGSEIEGIVPAQQQGGGGGGIKVECTAATAQCETVLFPPPPHTKCKNWRCTEWTISW